jgi:hypothetical protein
MIRPAFRALRGKNAFRREHAVAFLVLGHGGTRPRTTNRKEVTMTTKLISAAAIVLLSGTMALAQTSTGTTATDAMGRYSAWDQTTRDAFFTNGTLRSTTDIQTGWTGLDATVQAKIRADCQEIQTEAGKSTGTTTDSGATATTGSTIDSQSGTQSTDSTSGSDSGSGVSTATPDMVMPDMASLVQLCEQVQGY